MCLSRKTEVWQLGLLPTPVSQMSPFLEAQQGNIDEPSVFEPKHLISVCFGKNTSPGHTEEDKAKGDRRAR